ANLTVPKEKAIELQHNLLRSFKSGSGERLPENMPIGRYGIINRIRDEQVEITESYKTRTGRAITKEIVMRLKKDGDK
ncbi:MAG: hypothetical protein D3920_07110, partial [Candidatus Electrothrix sp. AW2]|nr:hypothetical protein [Candidatus Electrothrix gigas]